MMRAARIGIALAVTLAMTSSAAAQSFTEDDLVTLDNSGNARNATAGGDLYSAPIIASVGYGVGGWGSSIAWDTAGTYAYAVSHDSNTVKRFDSVGGWIDFAYFTQDCSPMGIVYVSNSLKVACHHNGYIVDVTAGGNVDPYAGYLIPGAYGFEAMARDGAGNIVLYNGSTGRVETYAYPGFGMTQLPAGPTLKISSTPAGASVFVDGKPATGVTPMELALPDGKHRIAVELEGFARDEFKHTAKFGEQRSAARVLKENGCAVEVAGITPPAATVSVDDQPAVKGMSVPPGPHIIKISAPKYEPLERAVVCARGGAIALADELTPLPGRLKVPLEQGATMTIKWPSRAIYGGGAA